MVLIAHSGGGTAHPRQLTCRRGPEREAPFSVLVRLGPTSSTMDTRIISELPGRRPGRLWARPSQGGGACFPPRWTEAGAPGGEAGSIVSWSTGAPTPTACVLAARPRGWQNGQPLWWTSSWPALARKRVGRRGAKGRSQKALGCPRPPRGRGC